MACREVEKFWCVYLVADVRNGVPGFNIGNVCVSCEQCLSNFLSSLGGTVIYKKRFKYLPPWEWIAPKLKKAGDDWINHKSANMVVCE